MKKTTHSFLTTGRLTVLAMASVAIVLAGCSGVGGRGTPPHACNPQEERAAYARATKRVPSNWVQADVSGDNIRPKTLNCLSNAEGEVLFEGDIVLGQVKPTHTKGIAIKGRSFRWASTTIPYTFTSNLPAQTRGWAETAMKDITRKTGFITFVPRTTQEDYINFAPGSRSNVGSSPVGRQGGGQSIKLGSATGVAVATHEICHSLGLWHEQSRSDRDQYICIDWDNIEDGMAYNFDQHVADGVNLGTYDFGSRMHYHDTAFSKNGRPTIYSKVPGQRISASSSLSSGDIAALRAIFLGNQSAFAAR